VILSHKVTVENHRNGLANARILNKAPKKPVTQNGKPPRINRLAKPSSSQETPKGLQFESSGNQYGNAEQTFEEDQAEFDDEAFGEELEDQQVDFSEEEESEESESQDEEDELPEGEPETRLGSGPKDLLSPAENHHNSGCASKPHSNSLGERQLKLKSQPSQTDGQSFAVNSEAVFSPFAKNPARSPPSIAKNRVGCTPECTREPLLLRETSLLKRLICRHSRKIRPQENNANYKLNKESLLALQARLLRLSSIQQKICI
jgi:hypothetical protein